MTAIAPATDLKRALAIVADGRPLDRAEAEAAFDVIMSGLATPAQIGGFLMALRVRGETIEEIAGAVAAMRARMLRVEAPPEAIDIVGTGGDGAGSYNVSTATAFVVAGCGVPVAKHGNRALSSKSGAADVLAALGVKIDLAPEGIARSIREAGVGFMFAPAHHAAMRHVGPARVELGTRTIFNLLGPLANPAGVKRQLVGVFASHWVEPVARALAQLGCERAWVCHGAGGLDEISTIGPTTVASLEPGGAIDLFEVSPEDLGIPHARLDDLRGGDGAHNAAALVALLEGTPGPYRDIVVMNAAGSLVVAGKARDFAEGAHLAVASIDSGAARASLARLVAISNAAAS
jgi:anthranilate phosphoribosyltransferase